MRRAELARIGLLAAIVGLAACASPNQPKTAEPVTKPEQPKPRDESRRFPKANRVDAKLVDRELMDKKFMPGGTLVRYKHGAAEYEMFAAKLATPVDAAVILPDWRVTLKSAKLIPSFGGYFGEDAGRPVFVFAKGAWIAGVAGLPLKQADAQARILAAALD